MRNTSLIGRAAALVAVALVVVAVVVIVLSGGSGYQVKAIFSNASQLVNGDQVEVAGIPIGSVSNIQLTPNGQAELTLSINDSNYQPLRVGTQATIREVSLSAIANRYVALDLGPANAPSIPNGGVIPSTATTSEVDLDELFDTLDAPTRKALQQVIQGSASQYAGKGALAQKAWEYLNPAVASSSLLFSELNRDTGRFTNFITKSAHLVSDIASRQSSLDSLVSNLASVTSALSARRVALGQSIQRLPYFMALADTTFVNLRNALGDVQPLVDVSKPVAPKLERLLIQLRPFAENSVPTVRDLANIISRPGPNNDLIELTKLGVPLANATVRPVKANGATRPGAFPESVTSLNDSTPELATDRPYAVDLTGWFEGYTHPGMVDANGGVSRVAPVVGLYSVDNGVTTTLLGQLLGNPTQYLQMLLGTGAGSKGSLLTTGQGDRCPGSMERGGIWYPESGYPCNPSEVPTGS